MAKTSHVLIGLGCGTIVLIGAGFMLLCGGMAMFGFGIYKDITKGADAFLAQLGNNDIPGAYQSSATLLRSTQTEADFTAQVKKLGLDGYQSSSWNQFNMVNDDATISGTVTTKTGSIPMTMKLVKESGVWKVSSINPPAAGVNTTGAEKTVPTNEKLRTMATTALLDFNKSLQANDFTSFHNTISLTWKAQTTPDELKSTFQKMIDMKLNIGAVDAKDIVIDGTPEIDEKGSLKFEGRLPRAQNAWSFRLKYVMENSEWKLLGIYVKAE